MVVPETSVETPLVPRGVETLAPVPSTLMSQAISDASVSVVVVALPMTEAADAVRTKYPFGVEQLHVGPYSGKNFYSYMTFSSGSAGAY